MYFLYLNKSSDSKKAEKPIDSLYLHCGKGVIYKKNIQEERKNRSFFSCIHSCCKLSGSGIMKIREIYKL